MGFNIMSYAKEMRNTELVSLERKKTELIEKRDCLDLEIRKIDENMDRLIKQL